MATPVEVKEPVLSKSVAAEVPKITVTPAQANDASSSDNSSAATVAAANILNGVGGLWVIRSVYVPRKSLRGNVSPATISSALSHGNRWTVRPVDESTPPPVDRLLQRDSSNMSLGSISSSSSSAGSVSDDGKPKKPKTSQWQVRPRRTFR